MTATNPPSTIEAADRDPSFFRNRIRGAHLDCGRLQQGPVVRPSIDGRQHRQPGEQERGGTVAASRASAAVVDRMVITASTFFAVRQ
jgi:hypothetical protein